MRFIFMITFAITLFFLAPVKHAIAQDFKHSRIMIESIDGSWAFPFAFVNCGGKLMLFFNADKKLNKFRKQSDGGLKVKYNGNKYQFVFYSDGKAMKRNGDIVKWKYPTNAEYSKYAKKFGITSSELKDISKAEALCK